MVVVQTLLLGSLYASVVPSDSLKTPGASISLQYLLTSKPAEIEKWTGKKLKLVEKIQLKLFQKKYRSALAPIEGEPTERQKKQGKISMILGIISVVFLFIPYINLIAIPAAIIALVLGIKSVKDNGNTQGLIGLITGAVTLFLFFIALILVAAYFSAWN